MQINRRFTNGLAWAGLILVVGVPTADLISAQFLGEPERVAVVARTAPVPAPLSQRPAAPAAELGVETAAVPVAPAAIPAPVQQAAAPAATPRAPSNDIVDNYLASGRALPSYITGGASQPAQAAATPPQRVIPATGAPAAVTTPPTQVAAVPPVAPAAVDPIAVASTGPQKIAPIPMPLSMRPRPVPNQLVVNEPMPPVVVVPPQTAYVPVTEDELDDWETGPLSDFLAERQGGPAEPVYDADGYFLSDGPGRGRDRDRLVGPVQDEFFFPFVD